MREDEGPSCCPPPQPLCSPGGGHVCDPHTRGLSRVCDRARGWGGAPEARGMEAGLRGLNTAMASPPGPRAEAECLGEQEGSWGCVSAHVNRL